MAKKKTIVTSGKRKRAIARATLSAGTGVVKINNLLLDHYGSPVLRQRIQEPLILAGHEAEKLDIKIRVAGGGPAGQADAIRLAIGRALAEHKDGLKSALLEYDRQLLVADVRRKESRKPNSHGKARARRQKSYR